MNKIKAFLARKDIVFSARRYGIDALGAMAQGLFCSLLIGTIIRTLGQQLHLQFLTDIGVYAMAVSGPAMAIAIGYALKCPPMVLFSLAAVGWAANAEGGAGGPLAVLVIAIIAAECGKAVSKETKIDILVTPAVTILVGVDEERVQAVIDIIKEQSHSRTQMIPTTTEMSYGYYPSMPVEVVVGGATIFVVDIERFERV